MSDSVSTQETLLRFKQAAKEISNKNKLLMRALAEVCSSKAGKPSVTPKSYIQPLLNLYAKLRRDK